MKHGMAIAWSLFISGAALADEVKLTSGRVFEGIAREESGRVVIETGYGTVTVAKDQVSSIVPGRTPLHEYQERINALGPNAQADQVFETALWAQEQHLTRYVNALLQWTIALDPDHAQARRMLDYVSYGGKWIPVRERDALLATRVQQPAGERRPQPHGQGQVYVVRRTRPQPEISPGYVYFGIPPSAPPRGTENHGYSDSSYSFSYPYTRMSAYRSIPLIR